jgi:hypothetical protein
MTATIESPLMDSLETTADPATPVPVIQTARPPRIWKFWGTLLWGLFVFTAMALGQIVPVALIVLWKAGTIDLSMFAQVAADGKTLSLSVMVGLPAVLAALWLPIHLSRIPFADYLALRWTSWQNLVIGIVAMVAVVMGWDMVSRATGHEVTAGFMGDLLQSARADNALWLAVLAFAVGAPITEELFARGFLYRGWSESFLRPVGAILLSSLLWTSAHLQYGWFFLGEVFSIGLVLGYIRYRSNSLWLTIVLHGLNNLAAVVQTLLLAGSG